jgi:hypothetical protein
MMTVGEACKPPLTPVFLEGVSVRTTFIIILVLITHSLNNMGNILVFVHIAELTGFCWSPRSH